MIRGARLAPTMRSSGSNGRQRMLWITAARTAQDRFSMAEWTKDEYGCYNLRLRGAHVWIQPRPAYCDRGHFHAQVSGIPSIDAADSFPRYFMDLERAKVEMYEWLLWRFIREAARENGDMK